MKSRFSRQFQKRILKNVNARGIPNKSIHLILLYTLTWRIDQKHLGRSSQVCQLFKYVEHQSGKPLHISINFHVTTRRNKVANFSKFSASS